MSAILRCTCKRCDGASYTDPIEFLTAHAWFGDKNVVVRGDQIEITEQLRLFDRSWDEPL
jgi:hypothetical protein